jgi:hypothetical protein
MHPFDLFNNNFFSIIFIDNKIESIKSFSLIFIDNKNQEC